MTPEDIETGKRLLEAEFITKNPVRAREGHESGGGGG
jgi:hypothetical protein